MKRERRAEPRVEANEAITVHLRGSGRSGKGRLIDINNKGAFVTTDFTVEDGVVVTMEVEMPGTGRPESINGVVIRRQTGSKTGLGIEFLPTSVEERDHIHYVVKTLLALDLLGYDAKSCPKPSDTVAFVRPVDRPDE